jgi:hypothetical protein
MTSVSVVLPSDVAGSVVWLKVTTIVASVVEGSVDDVVVVLTSPVVVTSRVVDALAVVVAAAVVVVVVVVVVVEVGRDVMGTLLGRAVTSDRVAGSVASTPSNKARVSCSS